VAYNFQTISNLPGVPRNTNLVRKVRMRVLPKVPN